MKSNQQSRPINGAIVRAYRQRLGLTQGDFAQRLGVSQGLVSQWESGRTDVGPDSQRRMWERFGGDMAKPSLGSFMEEHDTSMRSAAPLASSAAARSLTLTVFRWNDEFSLDAEPNQLEPCGLVTLAIDTHSEAVAIEMPATSRHQRGDIVVFARTAERAPSSPGRWLVQQRRGSGAKQVLIIEAKQGGSSPPRSKVQLPKNASFDGSAVDAVFRAVYQGTYL